MLGFGKSTILKRSPHIPIYQVLIETHLTGVKYIVPKMDYIMA
jgi:uracil phosphoribosyltransferase